MQNEINFIAFNKYVNKVLLILKKIEVILETSFLSNENKSSIDVVIVGKTNVGKSSLFNRILGYERSIITNRRGTTRDTVEAELVLENINVTLIDTAGIRKTKELVEKRGISRTYSAIKKANIVLYIDSRNPRLESEKHIKLIKDKKTIFVQNKIDINTKTEDKKTIKVSATKNKGISRLFTELSTIIKKEVASFKAEHLFLISLRQKTHLLRSRKLLKRTIVHGKKTKDLVVFVSCLRKAHEELAMLAGHKDETAIINNIFKDFCVGK